MGGDSLVPVIVPIYIVKFEIVVRFSAWALLIRNGSAKSWTVISDPVIRVCHIILNILLCLKEEAKHGEEVARFISPLILYLKC